MKKLLLASFIVLATIGFSACGDTATTTTDGNETVIDTDTAVSELEVQRTTVEVERDTNTTTETVDVER